MARLFVGNLPMDIREREIEDLFYQFGRITDIDLKFPRAPPAFCFVSFRDSRDAYDAVRYRDGEKFDGRRLRVELSKNRGDGGGHRDRYDDYERKRYRRSLSPYRHEKKKKPKKSRDDSDGSHDDTVGHYKGGSGDIINSYEVVKEVGVGTFGRVLECIDRSKQSEDIETSKRVAIKVVRNIKKYTESASIEASILKDVTQRSLTEKNKLCVQLCDQFEFNGHYCLVFESLGRSLYDYIKMNDYKPFPYSFVKSWTQQLLQAVQFLHKFELCHTDLKPENVLSLTIDHEHQIMNNNGDLVTVPASSAIKVIDFGGATYDNDSNKSNIVNTRQYRAPEVMLDVGWSMPSDCWSIGCIAAELYQGELLFATHGNREHLALIQKCCGPFPERLLKKTPDFKKYFHSNGDVRMSSLDRESEAYVRKMLKLDEIVKISKKKSLNSNDADLKHDEPHNKFYELVKGLLTIDPRARLTATQGLDIFGEDVPNEVSK